MVTVVVSLLLVARSVTQNTAALRTSNDNFLYERQDAIVATLVTDSSLAELQVKHENKEQLSDVEYVRMWNQHFRDLLMWELAFVRFQEGYYTEAQWRNWDNAYSLQFLGEFPPSWWAEARPWTNSDFAEHVDAKYKAASGAD
jgi:hypothetical protein